MSAPLNLLGPTADGLRVPFVTRSSETISDGDWSLVIAPNRASALVVVALAWLFCLFAAWLGTFALPPESSNWVAWVPIAPFGLVITWYGLKTSFLGAGRITLTAEGFTVSDGRTNRVQRRWNEIEIFFLDTAFTSPVFAGKEAPHFRLNDGTVDWLPQNGGHSAADVVAVMEGARRLASLGWPIRPKRLSELTAWADDTAGPATVRGDGNPT